MESWGKRLTIVLKEKGLTIRAAALLAGVAPSVMDSWTAGSSPQDFMAVRRLCDSLGVSFAWLLTGTSEAPAMNALHEAFTEEVVFDGLAKIKIEKLIPRS